jgi:hypothetical protein
MTRGSHDCGSAGQRGGDIFSICAGNLCHVRGRGDKYLVTNFIYVHLKRQSN